MEHIDARIGAKSQPRQLTILDTAQVSDEIDMELDYCTLKIAPIDSTGLASAVTIELLLNGRPVYLNSTQIFLTFPDEDFVWMVVCAGGARKVSLRLSAVVTDDVVFTVTGYDPVVTL